MTESLATIRRARVDDAVGLAALANEIHALHARERPDVFKPASDEVFSPAGMAALVGDADHWFWVAEEAGEIVGFAHAQFRVEPEMPWRYGASVVALHSMGVTASRRSAGIGTRLLAAVRQATMDRRADEVQLTVWSFNEGARRFYQRHGFALNSERLVLLLGDE